MRTIIILVLYVFIFGYNVLGSGGKYDELISRGIPAVTIFLPEKQDSFQINERFLTVKEGKKELRRVLDRFTPDLPVTLVCSENTETHRLYEVIKICADYPDVYVRIYISNEMNWALSEKFNKKSWFEVCDISK